MSSMSSYPYENYFRPNYEWMSSAAAGLGIVGMATMPDFFWPNAVVGTTTLSICTGIGLYRFKQGLEVYRHHRALKSSPKLEMRGQDIPKSKGELYLGQGFWWKNIHTQRLHQARLSENQHYIARNDNYERVRAFERKYPNSWITKLTKKEHLLNPFTPLPPTFGDSSIHGIEPKEQAIFTSLGERVGHMFVVGTTRVGKTRLAEMLITQDIERGDVVIVFDPKGDVDLLKRMYVESKRCGREKDFWFFHLGYPELSDRYSPVSTVGRITEVATRVANALPGSGNSAAFKQFAWGYVNAIARALEALGENATYESIYKHSANLDALGERYFEFWLNNKHPGWDAHIGIAEKALEKLKFNTGRSTRVLEFMDLIERQGYSDPIADELKSILSNSKTKYQALINSLFPLLSKLTTGKIGELLSPKWDNVHDKRRIFDWDKIMNMGGIVYIGLDALSDAEVSSAVGNAMFADLTSAAGRRYKFGAGYGQGQEQDLSNAKKVSIHADEFNELIGAEFVPLLNKAGGAGYQVTAYTQTLHDIQARLDNAAKAEQIIGNLNSLIMLRVKNKLTAQMLTEQVRRVEIITRTINSSAGDINDASDPADFTSNTADQMSKKEVPMVDVNDVMNLPKGQCFALIEGGQLAKIRLPMPAPEPHDWPENLKIVFDGMHKQYSRYANTEDHKYELIDWEQRYFDGLNSDGLIIEGKMYG